MARGNRPRRQGFPELLLWCCQHHVMLWRAALQASVKLAWLAAQAHQPSWGTLHTLNMSGCRRWYVLSKTAPVLASLAV